MTEAIKTKTNAVTVEHIMDFEAETYRTVLRAPRHDGQVVEIEADRSALLKPADIKASLANKGADPDCVTAEELKNLMEITTANERFMVSKPGWLKNNRFAWPARVIKNDGRTITFSRGPDVKAQYGPLYQFKGTLKKWRSSVGKLALRSSYMTMGIGVVLAAPLFRFAKISEGGVFHFGGESGTGKSLSQAVGQSLMGNPKRSLMWSWNATAGGDDRLFHSIRDFALVIDDTSRDGGGEAERTRRMTAFSHAAAGGGARRRAKSYDDQYGAQSARNPIFGLSSGEERHHELAAQTNQRLAGGARVRLIDIAVPAMADNGVFDRLSEGETGAEIADQLETAIMETYGWPFRIYLRFLERNFKKLRGLVDGASDEFLKAWEESLGCVPDTSQHRVASKFALVYAGLVIGLKAKILIARRSQLLQAVLVCLEANQRPTTVRAELIASAIHRLKKCIESDRHFPLLKPGQKPGPKAKGFRRMGRDGKIWAAVSRSELCRAAKIEPAMENMLIAELVRRGAFQLVGGKVATRQPKVKGERQRRYLIDPTALG